MTVLRAQLGQSRSSRQVHGRRGDAYSIRFVNGIVFAVAVEVRTEGHLETHPEEGGPA
jgi:hypothetical protein